MNLSIRKKGTTVFDNDIQTFYWNLPLTTQQKAYMSKKKFCKFCTISNVLTYLVKQLSTYAHSINTHTDTRVIEVLKKI